MMSSDRKMKRKNSASFCSFIKERDLTIAGTIGSDGNDGVEGKDKKNRIDSAISSKIQ
jgi:hypothetical protein